MERSEEDQIDVGILFEECGQVLERARFVDLSPPSTTLATACRSASRNSGWSSAMTRWVLAAIGCFLRTSYEERPWVALAREIPQVILPRREHACKRPNNPMRESG